MNGIYCIRNKKNGMFYIGRSKNIQKRFVRHKRDLKENKHHCIYLQRAWNKYGEDEFVFDFLKECNDEDSLYWEQVFLDFFKKTLYNVSRDSNFGGDLISKNPRRDEIIDNVKKTKQEKYKLMKEDDLNKYFSERYSRKGSKNGMYQKKHSAETIEKIRASKLGKVPPNKGKKLEEYCSPEVAKSIKETLSQKAKERVGEKNSFYGKRHSEESKRKISQANKGKKAPNRKPVIIDGNTYESIAEASSITGISSSTIYWRIKSPKKEYNNYQYLNKSVNA